MIAPTLDGHLGGQPLSDGVGASVGALADGVEPRGAPPQAPFTVGRRLDERLAPHAERLVRRPRVRRLLFGQSMRHPERLPPTAAAARIRASAGCTIYWELMEAMLRDAPPRWLGVDGPVLVSRTILDWAAAHEREPVGPA